MTSSIDYAGVKMSSRTANSKAAASEATNIFQSHYPELLVSMLASTIATSSKSEILYLAQKILYQCAYLPHLDILGIPIDGLFRNICKDVCCRPGEVNHSEGS